MPKQLKAIVFFGIMAVIGFFISHTSWNGETFISVNNMKDSANRSPAAVKKVFDYSQFEGTVLSSMSKQRLVMNATVENKNGSVGLKLGHFVIKTAEGLPVLACQMFDNVILDYVAEGMAVDGEVPQMQIKGPCSVVQDINSMESLWVPFAKILAEKPIDSAFNFTEANPIAVEFKNISEQWPKRWAFKSIQLTDSKGQHTEVTVSAIESGRAVAQALTIDLTK